MPKSEKEDNSAKYLRNFTKTSSGHLHFGYKLYAKNPDHSSSSYPGILLTRSCMGLIPKYEKGNNSVIYSPNFMKS